MTTVLSRRQFAGLVGLSACWPFVRRLTAGEVPDNFHIRTITAGLQLENINDLEPAREAMSFLRDARAAFEREGHQVQTLRLATQPLPDYLPDWSSPASLEPLRALDQFAEANGVVCSIGPVIADDHYHDGFSLWASELIRQTKQISFSCRIASTERGVHLQALRSAAEAMYAITRATPEGEGNFRFAATAFIPSGTPFFPAAFFDKGSAFSIGLESPNLLVEAFQGNHGLIESKQRLKARMEAALGGVEDSALKLAQNTGWDYLGIDTSPAPGLGASIGQAIETLTGKPFGSAATLAACAAITDVLKGLDIKSCGYSGLMLPVLEDKVLAQRAAEQRYGISELLLYSSVCGTGLDVVPLPGDASVEALTDIIADVAALATKYRKPLSARLFPVPGKQAGEPVRFDNPYLTPSIVMPLA
jgi:hypothetical protein